MNFFQKKIGTPGKTPTVLQMEAVECGAASLAMILAYHGLKVPLERLRIECGVSRDGSKASNLLKAARKFGLEAKGFRKEPESLKSMQLPAIVFWNFNHFVVLEGFKGDKVYLNDPASGKRVIGWEEFDQAFTGIVLTFTLGDDFKKGGSNDPLYKALGRRVKNSGSALSYIVLAGLFLVIPGLVIPVYSRIFVDNVLIGGMDGWFRPLLVAMGLTALVRAALTWLQQYYLLRFETRLSVSSSARFLYHIFRLPIEFFSQRMPGEIVTRIQLNDNVANLLSNQLSINMLNLVMVVFYAVVMFYYDVTLTLVGISVAIINLVALKWFSSKRIILNQKLQQETGKFMGVSMSGLQMIETLKASGGEQDFFAKWSGHEAQVINAQQNLAVPSQFLMMITPLLMQLNSIAVLGYGGMQVMDGHLTMGMLIAFQSLMASFMGPFNQLVNLGSLLQQTVSDIRRLDDAMEYPEDPRFAPRNAKERTSVAQKLAGNLELRNLEFGYSRLEAPLISEFSATLKPGQRIAFVGGSGSGKSTVAKMISGLYQPWNGDIFYDGQTLYEVNEQQFYRSVAMVDQEIFIFSGTIRDNLTMWDSTISDEDVVAAARDACIHDVIAARSGGYRSEIEEGGGNFSGGQRQRLEIARALAINPSILILDEATSALDPQTEKEVMDNIRRRGVTSIIIAHRLSTIRDCDEIIVLKKGKIMQRGTHEQMKQEDGAYAELIHSY